MSSIENILNRCDDLVSVGVHVGDEVEDARVELAALRRQLTEAEARTAKAVEEEREACAKLADFHFAARISAAAIRARGSKGGA